MITSHDTLRAILTGAKSIAVVGASVKPWRASNDIQRYLAAAGYTVYPVNPAYTEVLGLRCYRSVRELSGKVDLVDIFRRSEEVLPLVRDAIAAGARTVWMQSGVVNEEAARCAEAAGLSVVMDRCIAVDHRLLLSGDAA